jgi:hypothetical protein
MAIAWKVLNMVKRKSSVVISILTGTMIVCILLAIDRSRGYLVVEAEGVELHLSRRLFNSLTVYSGHGSVETPARSYTPRYLMLTARDGDDTWQLESTGPWGVLDRIKINQGETTTLKCGPPLRIDTQTSLDVRQVCVDLVISGRGGERYRNVVLKNGDRVSAPKVKLIDQDGNVLVSSRFKYG